MALKQREIWDGTGFSYPNTIAALVRRREEQGFDGRNFGDSQNRYGDPFVSMGLAVGATRTLRLSSGVANPITRHPALMAACIGTVQIASAGRAELGIARGDSALAYIGMAPAPLATFENYARALQGYLSGTEVPFELANAELVGGNSKTRSAQTLTLGKLPTTSRMQWLPGDQPKVPVNVYATGPRMIEIGARVADRVTFAVGADPERIRWAIDLARQARRDAGLDPDSLSLAAMIGMGLDDDLARARARIAGVVATSARFSFMHTKLVGPADAASAEVFRRLRDSYDMTQHSVHTSDQASVLPDWFIDRHAVTGGSSACIDRMLELYELGLDRLVLLFHGTHHGSPQEIDAVYERFSREVIPAVRR